MEGISNYAVGIDIGGTTTKIAIVNSAGDIHSINTIDTEGQKESEVYIRNLVDATEQFVKRQQH